MTLNEEAKISRNTNANILMKGMKRDTVIENHYFLTYTPNFQSFSY